MLVVERSASAAGSHRGNSQTQLLQRFTRRFRDLRIRVEPKSLDLGLELRVADVRSDGEDHREILPAFEGLFEQGLGALPSLYEKHSGNGPDVFVGGAERLDQGPTGGLESGDFPGRSGADQEEGAPQLHRTILRPDECGDAVVLPHLGIVRGIAGAA